MPCRAPRSLVVMRATPPRRPSHAMHRFACMLLCVPCSCRLPPPPDVPLEDLCHEFGVDKGRDDHGYIQVYATLFDTIRLQVQNITEIGVLEGQSASVWARYFPNAHYWGLDIAPTQTAVKFTAGLPRVRLLKGSSQDAKTPARHGLAPESMDVIIDDGDHTGRGQIITLEVMWPLLAPNGYYIIEDIPTGTTKLKEYGNAPRGFATVAHNSSAWPPYMKKIYDENDVFFADTLIGTRQNKFMHKMTSSHWMQDRINHNSHLIVIRKRPTPRTRPVQSHWHQAALKFLPKANDASKQEAADGRRR